MDIKLHDSLADSFRWRCKESANSTAIKFLDREQTYAELDSNSNLIAQGLLELGIKPDSRIAYLAKNTDYFFEIFYGSLKARAVVVGVNYRLAAEEVAYVLENSNSEILFVSPEFFEIIDQISDRLSSIKKINKGQELTYDYGYEFDKDDYRDHICKCGYNKCIGYIISSDDWKKFAKHISQITKK